MDINPKDVLQKEEVVAIDDAEYMEAVEVVAIDEAGGVEAVVVEAEVVDAVGVEDIDTCDIINNTLVCYCIRNETKNKTYVGATNHFTRRIRQHNREIVGGAKSTAGHKWHKIILVHGFNTRHDLLSFEWHFKHVVTVNKNGVKRRVEALKKLLSIDRWKMLKVVVSDELKEFFT